MQSLIFFGSDQYSAIVLSSLITSNVQLLKSVVTDKYTPPSSVEKIAIEHNLKVSYYPEFDQSLITKNALGLCASFDHLIPKEIIEKFGGNLYNLHPSLLPQYRNVAPVPYAIALGDTETGITLQRIDEKIDHGEILAQQSEPILPGDTTPTLLHRLFTIGAKLFLKHLLTPEVKNASHSRSVIPVSAPLIFTKKLTSVSGYLEWPVLLKLINGESITPEGTINPLVKLRLSHHQDRQAHILPDLIRALSGYEKVWTTAPTRKGDLRISFVYTPGGEIRVLIPGKPRPITWADFEEYYLRI